MKGRDGGVRKLALEDWVFGLRIEVGEDVRSNGRGIMHLLIANL